MNNQKIAFSKVYQSSNNDINEINIEWKKYYALERRMKSKGCDVSRMSVECQLN